MVPVSLLEAVTANATVPRRHILARRTRRRAHGLGDPFDHDFG
jgi:hypothetical protein